MDFYFRRSEMKKLLVGMIVLLSVVAFVNAAETAATTPETAIEGVDITVDNTFVTKYIWRGFNVYGSKGAWQPSIDFAFENGFSANVWMSYPIGTGENDAGSGINSDLTEYDYVLAYSNNIMEDVYQTNYKVGWRYYDYTKTSTKDNDMQEVFVEFNMPNIIGNGLTPRGAVYQMWNSESGGDNSGAGGTIMSIGVGYDFTLEQAPEIPLNVTWDIVYNGGTGAPTEAGYAVGDVVHDWSHQVFGLSTVLDCPGTDGKIVPAIYWQNSFEDTVNENNELWAGLSFALDF
jgi:uncharacterized protein (TIGR02001 family)